MHRNPLRSLVRPHCLPLIACGLLLSWSNAAHAQTGGTGQTGGGQTGGGTGLGGNAGGTGGGNQAGGLGGIAGQLAGPELMTFGAEIDATGGTGFAGRGNVGENFVGGLVQQGQGQTPFGNAGRANNQFAAINRQGQINRSTQPTGPSRSDRIRPRHRIAFNHTPRQTQTVTSNLQTWLGSLPGNNVAGVDVAFSSEGVATLSGTVADDHAHKLAAALARLEPGVRSVDNQLTITGSSTSAP